MLLGSPICLLVAPMPRFKVAVVLCAARPARPTTHALLDAASAGGTFNPSVAYEYNVSIAVFQSLETGPVVCLCARSTCCR